VFDRAHLSDLEREFHHARKDYMDEVENTTNLLKLDGAINLAAFRQQHSNEERAFQCYQAARDAFRRAWALAA
jgi:hypothetical protein